LVVTFDVISDRYTRPRYIDTLSAAGQDGTSPDPTCAIVPGDNDDDDRSSVFRRSPGPS
jgi:hypothetical protein